MSRARPEPTIGLINVVFLMLIFFLIAGSIAPSPEAGLTLVRIADLTVQPPPDALVLTAEGGFRLDGADPGAMPEAVAAYVQTLGEGRVARILPDAAAPAEVLVRLAEALRAAGAERVMVLGERALP
jgi:biopolymer transport protein ExbD